MNFIFAKGFDFWAGVSLTELTDRGGGLYIANSVRTQLEILRKTVTLISTTKLQIIYERSNSRARRETDETDLY